MSRNPRAEGHGLARPGAAEWSHCSVRRVGRVGHGPGRTKTPPPAKPGCHSTRAMHSGERTGGGKRVRGPMPTVRSGGFGLTSFATPRRRCGDDHGRAYWPRSKTSVWGVVVLGGACPSRGGRSVGGTVVPGEACPSRRGKPVGGTVVAGLAWKVPDDELVLTGGAQPTMRLRQKTARHKVRARLRKIIKLSQIVATVGRNAVMVDRPPIRVWGRHGPRDNRQRAEPAPWPTADNTESS